MNNFWRIKNATMDAYQKGLSDKFSRSQGEFQRKSRGLGNLNKSHVSLQPQGRFINNSSQIWKSDHQLGVAVRLVPMMYIHHSLNRIISPSWAIQASPNNGWYPSAKYFTWVIFWKSNISMSRYRLHVCYSGIPSNRHTTRKIQKLWDTC